MVRRPRAEGPVLRAANGRHLATWLAALGLAACTPETSPEQQVRAVIEAGERAAESRDATALAALVADDYADGRGNDADGIRRYARGYLFAHQSVRLVTRIDEVELMGDELARVQVSVGMLGRDAEAESAWDLAADVRVFDLRLALDDGEWRVIRADWQ